MLNNNNIKLHSNVVLLQFIVRSLQCCQLHSEFITIHMPPVYYIQYWRHEHMYYILQLIMLLYKNAQIWQQGKHLVTLIGANLFHAHSNSNEVGIRGTSEFQGFSWKLWDKSTKGRIFLLLVTQHSDLLFIYVNIHIILIIAQQFKRLQFGKKIEDISCSIPRSEIIHHFFHS